VLSYGPDRSRRHDLRVSRPNDILWIVDPQNAFAVPLRTARLLFGPAREPDPAWSAGPWKLPDGTIRGATVT
jgi:hypothetical protein